MRTIVAALCIAAASGVPASDAAAQGADPAEAMQEQIDLLIARGSSGDAIPLARNKARTVDTDDSWRQVLKLADWNGDAESALIALQALVRLSPDDRVVRLTLAQRLLWAKRYREALLHARWLVAGSRHATRHRPDSMSHTGGMGLDRMCTTACLAFFTAGIAAAAMGGCRKPTASQQRDVHPGAVRLDTKTTNLRHDRVGHGKWQSQATFVLADAHNTDKRDLLVTLRAVFVDRHGAQVGISDSQSLRIPAGGVRTFALVDNQQRVRTHATSARVEVMGAYAPDHPPPVQITDGKVYRDGDRVVVNAMVRNAVERPVHVIVIAGFYDRDGKPMTRPFTSMYVPGDGNHPAEFVGPPGSVKGYIFVGDMVY
ncbi:MAG: hypothetical protein MJE77_16790 [Proteobacteria bacterium]|nr:hypothetical protein [Pseudomonadota bacterium]